MPPITPKEKAMLLGTATQAMEHAYAPYSDFHVGAALVTEDGRLFTGCNVENASYGLTICAERAAIFNAINQVQGKLKLRAIAVVNGRDVPCSPCGACRQVIAEFGKDTSVIYRGEEGYVEKSIADLLPDTFHFS